MLWLANDRLPKHFIHLLIFRHSGNKYVKLKDITNVCHTSWGCMFSLQVVIVNKRELGCGFNQGSYISGFQHGHCMEVNFSAYMCASWLIKLEKRIALSSCWREVNDSLHLTYLKSLTGPHPALKMLDWKCNHCFWNQISVKPKTIRNWCTGNGPALWPPNVRSWV